MAAKSVIEIDVNDEKFKSFIQLIDKYQDALSEIKQTWSEITDKSNKYYDAAQKSQNKFIKGLKDLNKVLQSSVSGFKTITTYSFNIAKNISDAVIKMSKFLSYGSIISGFGFGGLAYSASDIRRRSTQYGIPEGALRASRVAFGRYTDVDSALSAIQKLQHEITPESQITKSLLGITDKDTPEQALIKAIQKAPQLYKEYGPMAAQFLQQYGVTNVLPYQDIAGLAEIQRRQPGEIQERINLERQLARKYSTSDTAYKAQQDFFDKLKEASNTIQELLIDKLKPLMPLLDTIVQKLTTLISNFIITLGTWLASDKFEEYSKKFIDLMEFLVNKLGSLAGYLGWKYDPEKQQKEYLQNLEQGKVGVLPESTVDISSIPRHQFVDLSKNEQAKKYAEAVAMSYGLPKDELWKLIGKESGYGTSAYESKKGAKGYAQFEDPTAKDVGLKDPSDYIESVQAMGLYLSQLKKKYGDLSKAEASYNFGMGRLDKILKYAKEHNVPWETLIPSDTQKYIGSKIKPEPVTPQSTGAFGLQKMSFQQAPININVHATNSTGSDLNIIAYQIGVGSTLNYA